MLVRAAQALALAGKATSTGDQPLKDGEGRTGETAPVTSAPESKEQDGSRNARQKRPDKPIKAIARRKAVEAAAGQVGQRPDPSQSVSEGPATDESDDDDWGLFSAIRLHLRSGAQVTIPLSVEEHGRVFSLLQHRDPLPPSLPYTVFDGLDGRKYALNLRQLISWAFVDDPCVEVTPSSQVRVLLAELPQELAFDVDVDVPTESEETGQLNYVFYMFETDIEPDDSLSLIARDGTATFFYAGNVALLSAPIAAIASDDHLTDAL